MNNETKFVDGMRVFAPRDGAPDFVIADIVIDHDEFADWVADRGDKVRITIKRSKGGKLYASENDWKPKEGNQERAPRPQPEQTGGGFDDDDVPFAPHNKRRHW